MPTPVVLATKLFIPAPRPQAVSRPRLVERLSDGLRAGRKLTLVSAPAGFGKTTVLADWIESLRQHEPDTRVAWLSLDEGDSDPARFLTYLLAAVHGADGIPSDGLNSEARQGMPVEAALTTLINEVAQSTVEIVLVLDDFHTIEAGPARDAVAFLVEHCPSNLHLAIGSRADPPFPLARMRGRGELTELRAADLRFTPDEAAAFLTEMGLSLSADDVVALDTRTEGWIAGLQLAALSMRERSDIRGFIDAFTGSNRFVIDYLVEEVLQRQPEQVRTFLLHSAVLDRLTGALCEAVTGQPDGAGMLEALERDNLFVIPLDDRREWYRYHHLFADVLRARLLQQDRDRVRALHRLASDWYARNDLVNDAVKHALAAEDFDRAATLMEWAVPAIRRDRQEATLLGWLNALPEDVIRQKPVLSVYFAYSRLASGALEDVEPWLAAAESALAAAPGATDRGQEATVAAAAEAPATPSNEDELRGLPVTIAMYRSALAQALGDVTGTAEQAGRALELAEPGDHLARGSAGGMLGLASWARGDLTAALPAFSEAMADLRSAGYLADVLSGTLIRADMCVAQGRLNEARRLYQQALTSAAAQDVAGAVALPGLHAGLAELHIERDDLDAAASHLQLSSTLGEGASLKETRYRRFVAMALLRQVEGDPDAVADLLGEADRLFLRGFFPEVRPIPAMRARIWITQGKLADALGWAREHGLAATDDVSYLREYEHLTLARLLIAQRRARTGESDIRNTMAMLDRLLPAAEAGGRTGSVTEILMLQALALEAQGQLTQAMVPLRRALTQAAPEGYVRLFANEGAAMVTLLNEAARRGLSPAYVRRLQAALGEVDAVEAPGATSAEPLAEPLSERELHVLRLLGTELSGPDIARELVVSLNTVRTHTKNIFRKLEVTNRRAAIRRAEQLNLLAKR
ncbi:LuxR C-terminal-related transcriptional regulator [Salinibacterium sp. ZJ450]|uniref:LuxR C-terminal-related transcriptional regulator n=1 Tax=Salinibacterium sp. ZJ450 TaxID=2708338 RepID=UPI001423AFE8|nr:LuxR C-terminal-related transcriptional regulator [Salinibacterium sp. ZJ450]